MAIIPLDIQCHYDAKGTFLYSEGRGDIDLNGIPTSQHYIVIADSNFKFERGYWVRNSQGRIRFWYGSGKEAYAVAQLIPEMEFQLASDAANSDIQRILRLRKGKKR